MSFRDMSTKLTSIVEDFRAEITGEGLLDLLSLRGLLQMICLEVSFLIYFANLSFTRLSEFLLFDLNIFFLYYRHQSFL
jgi:hypothetical protein